MHTSRGPIGDADEVVVAPRPLQEARRLAALARTLPDPAPSGAASVPASAGVVHAVREAARLLDVPVACITRVDAEDVDVVAAVGAPLGATSRDAGFGSHAIASGRPTVVADLRRDPRFEHHPAVAAGPRLRGYASAPIISADGHGIGALCVLDHRTRTFDDDQVEHLVALAEAVAAHLEQRSLAETVQSFHDRSTGRAVPDGPGGRGPVRRMPAEVDLAVAVEEALAVVSDHEGWPLCWAHVAVGEDDYRVVGARGLDPEDLEVGLALYEMRHRLQDWALHGRARRVELDDIPSTLAILAEDLGGTQLLVVPVESAAGPPAWLVLGTTARPELQAVLLRELDRLAGVLSAGVAAPALHAAPPARPRVATDVEASGGSVDVEHVVSSAARAAALALGVEVELRLEPSRGRVHAERLRAAVEGMVRAVAERLGAGGRVEVHLTSPDRRRIGLAVTSRGGERPAPSRDRARRAHPSAQPRPAARPRALEECAEWHGGHSWSEVAPDALCLRLDVPRRLLVRVPPMAAPQGGGRTERGPRSVPGA